MAEKSPERGGLPAGSGESPADAPHPTSGDGEGAGATPPKPRRARSTTKASSKPAANKSTASQRAANSDRTPTARTKATAAKPPAKASRGTAAATQSASGTRAVTRAPVSRTRRAPVDRRPKATGAEEPDVVDEPPGDKVSVEAEEAEDPETGDNTEDLEDTGERDGATPGPGLLGRARKRMASPVVAAGMTVALVAAVVLLILTWLQLSDSNSLNHARAQALTAAKAYAVEIGSYNYRTLNQDFGKVMSDSTPAFRASYSKSSNSLKQVLGKYNASSKATVVSAGLVSASSSRAVALVFLNQTVTNTTQKGKPTTDQSRLEMTLLHSGGRWLINNVSLL